MSSNLLAGKILIYSDSYKGTPISTTTVVTDGLTSGSRFSIDAGKCLYYEFEKMVDLTGHELFAYSGANNFRIDYFDKDGILIESQIQSSNPQSYTINNVKGFALFNTRTLVSEVYELKILGTEILPKNKILLLSGQNTYSHSYDSIEDKATLTQIPSSGEDNLVKYGMDSPVENLEKIIHHKNYILQDGISENENGYWTTKLDRKPLSIKFE